jgi:hypothetical protein
MPENYIQGLFAGRIGGSGFGREPAGCGID